MDYDLGLLKSTIDVNNNLMKKMDIKRMLMLLGQFFNFFATMNSDTLGYYFQNTLSVILTYFPSGSWVSGDGRFGESKSGWIIL